MSLLGSLRRTLCLVLLASIILLASSTVHAKVVVGWGDSMFMGVGTKSWDYAAIEPTLLTHTFTGEPIPEFIALASADWVTVGLTDSQELWAWGSFGTRQGLVDDRVGRGPQKLIFTDDAWPFSSSNRVKRLFGSGNGIFVVDKNDQLWSFSLGFSNPGPQIGRYHENVFEIYAKIGPVLFEDASSNKLSLPLSKIECHPRYCLGLNTNNTQNDLFFWGDGASDFSLSTNRAELPTNCSAAGLPLPADATIHHIALGETWFFLVASLPGTPIIVYSTGLAGQESPTSDKWLIAEDPPLTYLAMQPSNLHSAFEGKMVKFVAAGHDHGLAANETLIWAWGDNSYGQLAAPPSLVSVSRIPRQIRLPVTVTISGLSSLAHTSYALTTAGEIYAWGRKSLCTTPDCGPNTLGYIGSLSEAPSISSGIVIMKILEGFTATSLPVMRGIYWGTENVVIHLLGNYTAPAPPIDEISEALVGWGSSTNGGADPLAIPVGNASFVWRGHNFPPLPDPEV